MFNKLIHKWLKIPYSLHVRYNQRPKKPQATVIFIHGIGNSGEAWAPVVKKLPRDIRVITIDLLGFGESPKPKWAIYSAKTQANSVLATFFKLRVRGPVVIVGHSLGALVAVEIAKRYPLLVKSLILCSPPFYKLDEAERRLLPRTDTILRDMYNAALKYPEQFVKLSALAVKYKLVSKTLDINKDNVDTYMAALEATIVNQSSLRDAKKLKLPIYILRGTLDPVVINRNLKELAKANKNVTLKNVAASHEVYGLFIPAVVKAIRETIEPK